MISESKAAIRVAGLTATYGRFTAVDDVSFSVGNGVCALLGPNGAGKTTILAAIMGLKAYRGEIDIHSTADGVVGETRRSVGYLPQRFDLAGGLRVHEAVAYAAWCNGSRRTECLDLADRALVKVGLADKRSHKTRSLSGGERQRLGIACAISHSPRVLLLDEPAVGLDPNQRTRLRHYLAGIAETTCVIMATHLLEDVQLVSETIMVVNHGHLVFDGPKDELMRLGSEERSEYESAIESAYRKLTGGAADE